jgi:hypothetical protein
MFLEAGSCHISFDQMFFFHQRKSLVIFIEVQPINVFQLIMGAVLLYLYMVPRQDVWKRKVVRDNDRRQKIRRPNVRRQNVHGTLCPEGQNVQRDKVSRGTKRPERQDVGRQNVKRVKMSQDVRRDKVSGDKTSFVIFSRNNTYEKHFLKNTELNSV